MGVSARRLEAHRDTAPPVPRPLAITAVVVNDFAARTLFCRLPDHTTGSERVAWQQGYESLRLLEESGYSRGIPDLWAQFDGVERISRAVPGDAATLKFHFPPAPDSAYSKLLGKPLTAIVTVDRTMGNFLRCRFLHRP